MIQVEAWMEAGQTAPDADDIAFLVELVHTSPYRRSLAAAFGLALCQSSLSGELSSRATEALCTALGHPDPDLRVFVANSLGQGGDRRAVPCLTKLRHDTVAEVKYAAERAIDALGDTPPRHTRVIERIGHVSSSNLYTTS